MRGDIAAYLQSIQYIGGYDEYGFPEPNTLVKKARLKLGLSQADVAMQLGVTRTEVTKLEQGHGINDIRTRREFTRIFGVLPAALGLTSLTAESSSSSSVNVRLYKELNKTSWDAYFAGGYKGGTKAIQENIDDANKASTSINNSSVELLATMCYMHQLGMDVAHEEGAYNKVKVFYENARSIAETLDDPKLLASTLLRYGAALNDAGDIVKSQTIMDEAMHLRNKIPTQLAGIVVVDAVRTYVKVDPKKALQLATTGVEIARSIKAEEENDWEEGFVRLTLPQAKTRYAIALLANGKVSDASEELDFADKNTDQNLPRRLSIIRAMQARQYYKQKQHTISAAVTLDSLNLARNIRSMPQIQSAAEMYSTLLKTSAKNEREVIDLGKSLRELAVI